MTRTADCFRCWMPNCAETSDEGEDIDAFDAWDAVKKYAKWADENSGGEMAQNGMSRRHDGYIVHCMSPDDTETVWRIWPEAEVRWYASKDVEK